MLAAGRRLGKYQLESLLGRGGMGEVWAARDPDLDRRVAVKVLTSALAGSAEALARLQREGRAMARLRHPNVITVHDAAFAEGRGLIAMELIDGENLASWLGKPHSPRKVFEALLAAGHGLAAAHDAGMVHRDFKPHNVLIERSGRVVVTDFGLARAIGPATAPPDEIAGAPDVAASPTMPAAPPRPDPASLASGTGDTAVAPPPRWLRATRPHEASHTAVAATVASDPALAETGVREPAAEAASSGTDAPGSLDRALTRTGALLGTPAYMAPEQLLARPTDARCDQFAFCVSAWEALTGARPFQGSHEGALLAAIEGGQVVNEARVPRRLRAILRRGLASDPAARWPSMAELLRAFERAWRRPRRIALASGVVVALGALAAAFVVVQQPGEPTCADDGAAIARQWPSTRASLLRSRMIATGAPYADRMYTGVAARYARYTEAWTAMRTAACTARRQGDPAAARTLACLDVRRTGLADSIADVIARAAPGKLGDIPFVTTLLEPIATCAHPADATGKFDDAARVRQAISDARKRVSNDGTHGEARRQLDQLSSQLDALGYPPLRAEVLIAAAGLASHDNDRMADEADLRQALALAESGDDDRVKITAAIDLVGVLVGHGQIDEARRLLELAEASLARLGVDIELESQIATERGALAYNQHSLDEAVRQLERALELGRQVNAAGGPAVWLIDVYTELGRTAEAQALEAERRALRPADGAAGAETRATDDCKRAMQAVDLDRAVARCTEAVALAERRLGTDAPPVESLRMSLGNALSLHGDHAESRTQYLAAAASADAHHAKRVLVDALMRAGLESRKLGDAPAAIEQFRRCAEVAADIGKSVKDELAELALLYARAGLGTALAAAHRDSEAITELEWALPRIESRAVPGGLGSTRLALADALWRRNGRDDRMRARVLAGSARQAMLAQKASLQKGSLSGPAALQAIQARDIDELIARIDRWRAQHR